MQISTKCKAVGKYKEQFKNTGLLLENVNGQEAWVDFPGQLSYKDYKGKLIVGEIEQNERGYWVGKFTTGQPASAPSGSYTPDNKDRLIVAQVVYKAMMTKLGVMDEEDLTNHADMIMRVGSQQPRM